MRQTYQETHKKILDHLLELGQKKGLTNVKVTDITKGLRINRGTFYLHFLDIPDAIEQLEEALIAPILSHLKEISTAVYQLDEHAERTLYTQIFQQIDQDFDIWQFLIGEKGDPKFEYFLRQHLSPIVAPDLSENDWNSFIHDLIVDSLISILRHWLLYKAQYPAQVIADILYQTRHNSPFNLVNRN